MTDLTLAELLSLLIPFSTHGVKLCESLKYKLSFIDIMIIFPAHAQIVEKSAEIKQGRSPLIMKMPGCIEVIN